MNMNYSVGLNLITKVFIREEGRQKVTVRFKDAVLLALQMEEEALSQGMQTPSKWKKQENRFFPRVSTQKYSPAHILMLAQ